jgi:hypothetical protein
VEPGVVVARAIVKQRERIVVVALGVLVRVTDDSTLFASPKSGSVTSHRNSPDDVRSKDSAGSTRFADPPLR